MWSLPFGAGRRWGSGASPLIDALIGGWQLAGINTVYAGEPVTFTYNPGATAVVSGIAQDFRGANNYRPNVTCDPMAAGAERTINNWFNRACVVAADRSEPAVRQRRAQLRARPAVLAVRSGGLEAVRPRRPGAVRVPARGVQPAQPHELPRAERQPQRRRRSARSPRPTIRGSSSSGSSCCGSARDRRCVLLARRRSAATAPPTAAHHRAPRRQRPSARAHARGLPPGGRDGRGLHRARSRLDEGRRAHRAPRERDRRRRRTSPSGFPTASAPRRSTASR